MTTTTTTRPLANVSALALTGMVLAGDVAAGAEAVVRLQTGVTGDERTVLVAAMNTVLAPSDDDEPETVAPASSSEPAVVREDLADIPHSKVGTDELCARVEHRAKGAWKEAKRRIESGIPAARERKLRDARKRAKGEIVPETTTIVSEHTGNRHRTATGLLAARVKTLSAEGDARRNSYRAYNLLAGDPVSLEDIEAFSDEQVMALVALPVRKDTTVLERLDKAGLL